MKAFVLGGGFMVVETTSYLVRYLQDAGYEVFESNHESDFLSPLFAECDLLVLNSCRYSGSGHVISDTERDALTKHFELGKGVVVMHSSIGNWDNWPAFIQLTGAAWAWGHSKHSAPDASFEIESVHEHPLLSGVSERFVVTDEMYYDLNFEPGNHVIAYTSEKYGRHPMAWWRKSLNAKVAAIMIGHDEQAVSHPQYIRLFLNACKWTTEVIPNENL